MNIINAVFVQQTMKTASSDEELAFKQKEKDGWCLGREVASCGLSRVCVSNHFNSPADMLGRYGGKTTKKRTRRYKSIHFVVPHFTSVQPIFDLRSPVGRVMALCRTSRHTPGRLKNCSRQWMPVEMAQSICKNFPNWSSILPNSQCRFLFPNGGVSIFIL